ncbi:hypothetical protein SNK04_009317 [Fusarium graminearum]
MSQPIEPLAPIAPSVSIDIPKEYNFGPTVLQPALQLPVKLSKRGIEVESLGTAVDTCGTNASPPPPPLDALEEFKGCFRGFGFNTIFRPSGEKDNCIFDKDTEDENVDNLLQLNLTGETQTFGSSLGEIPNRGLFDQADINLTGFPYTQTIVDAMPPGKESSSVGVCEPPIIHFEPGLWMRVPQVEHMPRLKASFCRMGSIPHGTTINAQGFSPSKTSPGAPDIPSISITPIVIPTQGSIAIADAERFTLNSQSAGNNATRRLPQDLSAFIANGTITQEILDNPNTILVDANRDKTIVKNIMFIVSTNAPPGSFGGGTSNIGFNIGADGGQQLNASAQNNSGNANAVDVTAQYWVSQVRAEIELDPSMKVGQTVSPAALHARDTVPEFFLDEDVTIPSSPKTVTVVYPQIQYSQLVFLDFNGLKWPHVTVATLAPIVQDKKPTLSSVIENKN